MWKLCLQGNGKRQIIEITPDASVSDLCKIVETKFEGTLTLKHGIPAQQILPHRTLAEAGIANQDRIIVECSAKNVTATRSDLKRRPQRAAAKQATDSMPALIAAQEAAAKSPPAKAKSTSPRKRKTTPSVQKHFASLESARRLKDGAQITTSPKKQRKKEQVSSSLEEGLIDARKNWKEAVNSAYEQNRAAARLAAPRSNLHFNPQDEITLLVEFPKGIQGRGTFTDSVDWIPREALQAAVSASEEAEEGLRPSNLALLSPRVFWALRYHFPADTVEESLRLCAPNRDWSFLRRRKQQLSQKARENLLQQTEAEGTEEMNHWEAAAEAIAAVEDAMANSFGSLSRPVQIVAQNQLAWSIQTPEDEDEDELFECIWGGKDGERTQEAQDIVQKMIPIIRNWRQLADCNSSDLVRQFPLVEASTIRNWIEYARLQTLEEIMVEVCDDDWVAVERLRDRANSGTPRDLAVWRSIAPTLQSIVPEYSVEQLERWCAHAQASMTQFSWLGDFVTPIA